MSKTARGRKKLVFLQKPSGRLTPRVQAVGPDHFGIIAVDPAKSRSCYMLCNFYGNVHIPILTVIRRLRIARSVVEAWNL